MMYLSQGFTSYLEEVSTASKRESISHFEATVRIGVPACLWTLYGYFLPDSGSAILRCRSASIPAGVT